MAYEMIILRNLLVWYRASLKIIIKIMYCKSINICIVINVDIMLASVMRKKKEKFFDE